MQTRQYKNPPIEEALCEFTFRPPVEGQQFDFTLPGRLLIEPTMAEYSGQSRTQNIQTIAAAENAANIAIHNMLLRIQLPTVDGKRILSVGTNTLAITVLRPYDGWQSFRPRIERALEAFSKISGVSSVVRIGVRYINRIVIPGTDVRPSAFLGSIPEHSHVSDAVLANFMERGEYVRHDRLKVIVTQATLQPTKPDTTEYLLDIDTLWDKEPLDDQEAIMSAVDQLHEIEGAAFEALITDESRELFDA